VTIKHAWQHKTKDKYVNVITWNQTWSKKWREHAWKEDICGAIAWTNATAQHRTLINGPLLAHVHADNNYSANVEIQQVSVERVNSTNQRPLLGRNTTPQGRRAPGTIYVVELLEIRASICAISPSHLCTVKFLGPIDFCRTPPTFPGILYKLSLCFTLTEEIWFSGLNQTNFSIKVSPNHPIHPRD
jgi:hypothetical protein